MRLRTSSSIVNFQDKAERIWGLYRYGFPRDIFEDVVFFGMYHIGDYFHYIVNRGKKTIVWAGSDIQALLRHKIPWHLLFKSAKNYVENRLEQEELESLGIKSEVRPSFLENMDDFPVSFKPCQWKERPQVFLSTCDPKRAVEYGIFLAIRLACRLPDIDFHIYGMTGGNEYKNVIFHGRVPLEQFNEEIKNYHCALRPNEHDGFSENLAKSVLMGQYPISKIKYPHIWTYNSYNELVRQLKRLKKQTKPNFKARDFWRNNLNKYDFIEKR
jgi:hypothetical protein